MILPLFGPVPGMTLPPIICVVMPPASTRTLTFTVRVSVLILPRVEIPGIALHLSPARACLRFAAAVHF
jgi:hypothetical protein